MNVLMGNSATPDLHTASLVKLVKYREVTESQAASPVRLENMASTERRHAHSAKKVFIVSTLLRRSAKLAPLVKEQIQTKPSVFLARPVKYQA